MLRLLLLICVSCPAIARAQSASEAAENWHQWRGPEANGVSRTATPPVEWSETENIQWKVPIDGDGSSVPIIWGNRVFLTTAVNTGRVDPNRPAPEDQKKTPSNPFNVKNPNTTFAYTVICLNRATGEELWRDVAIEKVPHEGAHQHNDFASASPTTDGERLWVWFGSAGLFCYDMGGRRVWDKQLGEVRMGALLGEGSSPVHHEGRLVLVRDSSQQSYIVCLDAATGDEIWRRNRDEGNGWATPRIIRHGGRTQVIMPGTGAIRSYDLATGDVIWQCTGLTSNCIPCPVVDGAAVFCMTGYRGHALMALPLSAQGDITGSSQILWTRGKGTPYVPSPLLYDGQLFFTKSNKNVLTSLDARTGTELIAETRLPTTDIYASPVAANGHVYFTDRRGMTVVLRKSDKLEIVARNKLNEDFDASPALAGNQLFLRGVKHLYCIGNTQE